MAQINRAIDGVRKAGVTIGSVEIRPDGSILVQSQNNQPLDLEAEEYFGGNRD